jgi:hypothetical protein
MCTQIQIAGILLIGLQLEGVVRPGLAADGGSRRGRVLSHRTF